MEFVTKQMMIKTVVEKCKKSLEYGFKDRWSASGETLNSLNALDLETATVADVENIIGKDYFESHIRCSECWGAVPVVVSFDERDEFDFFCEDFGRALCVNCVDFRVALLKYAARRLENASSEMYYEIDKA